MLVMTMWMCLGLLSIAYCDEDPIDKYLLNLSKEFPGIKTSLLNEKDNHSLTQDCPDLELTFTVEVSGKGFHRILNFHLNSTSISSLEAFCIFQRLRQEVFGDPFELGNLNSEWKVEGPIDLETPAPGSSPMLLFHCSRSGSFPVNITLPFHVRYQQPISGRGAPVQGHWLSTGPYVSFQLNVPVLLLWNGNCKYKQKGNEVDITVPTGNLDHLQIVVVVSVVVLLLSTVLTAWSVVSNTQPIDSSKTKEE